MGSGKSGKQMLWRRGAALSQTFKLAKSDRFSRWHKTSADGLTASGRWSSMSDLMKPKKKKKKKKSWFWNSVAVWNHGPWVVIGMFFFICNMGVIMAGALVFQDCPDVVKTW